MQTRTKERRTIRKGKAKRKPGTKKPIGTKTGHTLESYIILALLFISINFILQVIFYFINKNIRNQNKKHIQKDKELAV